MNKSQIFKAIAVAWMLLVSAALINGYLEETASASPGEDTSAWPLIWASAWTFMALFPSGVLFAVGSFVGRSKK